MSQYVVRKAKEGHTGWRAFIICFPLFIIAVSIWLMFHWEGMCIVLEIEIACGIDV